MQDNRINVVWIHNYDPSDHNSGNFMKLALSAFRAHRKYDVSDFFFDAKNIFKAPIKTIIDVRTVCSDAEIIHIQYGSLLSFIVSICSIGLTAKKIITLRGSDINRLPIRLNKESFHSQLAYIFTRVSLIWCTSIITVSNALRSRVKYQAVSVIPSPIDPIFFDTPQDPEKKNPRRILFSALEMSSVNKRFSLAQSTVELYNSKSALPLELITATNMRPTEMVTLIDSCSLILLTSRNEGWPNIIKEGLARGVPFVSTDVSDLKELSVVADGFCAVCDPERGLLAGCIDGILRKNLDVDAKHTLKSLGSEYGVQEYVARQIDVYEKALK